MKIAISPKKKQRFVFASKKRTHFVFQKTPAPLKIQGTDSALGVWYEDAAWGVRIVHSDQPRAYVKDCRTGSPILKEDARCLGRGKDGNYYWLKRNERTYIGEKSHASVWAEGEVP